MKVGMTTFLDEVKATPGGEHILACIQCGTCTGSCPMAAQMEYPPRKIIAMIRAGMRDEVLSSNSMWFCLSCYMCTARCPRGVKPTEIAHALESLANQQGFRVGGTSTPAMYRSFVDSIKGNGRVHEFGMMVKFYLSILPQLISHPVDTIRMSLLGLNLWRHKRLPLMPERIKGKGDLSRIIQKFREARSDS
jgi:heterodisulfide reductase subunit C